MEQSIYLLRNGRLKRKDNNLTVIDEEGNKKDLKVEMIRDIYIFGEISLNSKVMNFLSQNKIALHIYNYYGYYSGTYYPKEVNIAGSLLVKQVKHYDDEEKRVEIARNFLLSASYNIKRNLIYYRERGKRVDGEIERIVSLREKLKSCKTVGELMGEEGNIRKTYYHSWNEIINQEIDFHKRVKRPPDNMINSLISFTNSLVYTAVLSEIYKTHLNPTISFLHEPGSKRFSLSLDIAEVFKPLIADRILFKLLNKNEIKENSFEKGSNYYALKDSAKKKVLKEFDERLNEKIMHKTLKRKVSYRYLIRLECYKLIKHLNGEKKYEGFKIWW